LAAHSAKVARYNDERLLRLLEVLERRVKERPVREEAPKAWEIFTALLCKSIPNHKPTESQPQ
jgi:hypothetical protein